MRPSFHPRLVNGPFDDPALYISLTFRKEALLFDLGDLRTLSGGDIHKVGHVFVTHTHMDHFIGFDTVLRLMLGRSKTLHLFGPQDFIAHVAAKLRGYTWNLVQNYTEALVLKVTEIRPGSHITQLFTCSQGFLPSEQRIDTAVSGIAYQDQALEVRTEILDHQIPCLAFAVQERFHVNILKARLEERHLPVGPWLTHFKNLLHRRAQPAAPITVLTADGPRTFELGLLAEQIARITPGQKIAYITDVAFTPLNEEKIIALAQGADHLFIEAAFLEQHRDIARAKYHLTAFQAGTLARKAQVKQLTIFHHSPRYLGQGHLLENEARRAFEYEATRCATPGKAAAISSQEDLADL
jgi:ribonuclease Z